MNFSVSLLEVWLKSHMNTSCHDNFCLCVYYVMGILLQKTVVPSVLSLLARAC